MLKRIFINKNSEVRSGWKIAIVSSAFFISTNVLVLLLLACIISYVLATGKVSLDNLIAYINSFQTALTTNMDSAFALACNFIQCSCMILSVIIFWKIFDKKPIRELGLTNLKHSYKDLIIGLIFGAISLTSVFAILLSTGNVQLINPFNKPNFSISLLTSFILFILVGINEELFTRGYCFTVLKQTNTRWVPIVGSSIIFALLHSFNPGMSALSYINLFLFGLFTVYMYLRSNNLWLSIGYHIAWNYFEGNVFGFLVSGQVANGIYNVKNPVNNLINGGTFGPEGGLIVTLVILLGFLYLWKFYKSASDKNLI